MEEKRFRGTLFGGFHREDVTLYLEMAAREKTERAERDRREIERLEQELRESAARESAAADRIASLERQTADGEQTRVRLRETQDALDRLRAEHARVLERLEELEPGYEKYETLRHRICEIEMEAHLRATLTEREAGERIAQRQRQLFRAIEEARSAYAQARVYAEDTTGRFHAELERTGITMGKLLDYFDRIGKEIEAIRAEAETAEGGPGAGSPPERADT